MPYYDLRCKSCNEEATIKATVTEKKEHLILCPACGSNEMASVFKIPPNYVRSGGSEPVQLCANSKECGPSCPHVQMSQSMQA